MFVSTNESAPAEVNYANGFFCAGNTYAQDQCFASPLDNANCSGGALGLTCYDTGTLNIHLHDAISCVFFSAWPYFPNV